MERATIQLTIGRLLAVAVLLLAASAANADASQLCGMIITVHANRIIDVDGTRYSLGEPERSQLKRRISSNVRRNPNCGYHLRADSDVPFKVLGEAVLVLQEAGAGKIGFLTEPRND